jgi:hypothetical protein
MPRLIRPWILSLAIILIASAIDILAFLLLRQSGAGTGTGTRIALALMPLPGDVAIIFLVLRAVRRLDDFQKRVHFEAVTVAFLATGVAVFVYGYLQQAQVVGALNTGLVWAFMLIFYGLGYLLAASHYR